MNHPDSAELTELHRGELLEDRVRAVEEHLRTCEKCHEEWKALGVLEQHLAEWHDTSVSPSFVQETMEMVETERSTPVTEIKGYKTRAAFAYRWLRRFSLAAGAVAASLLFQAMIWNPLGTSGTFTAVFDLIPAALALPAGQAVPDTVLVLTLYNDDTFETALLEGRYEVEDLIDELLSIVDRDRFRKIVLVGKDPDAPMTFRLDKLQRLLDELEINNLVVGEGVMGLQITEDRVARVSVPVSVRAFRNIYTDQDSSRAYVIIHPDSIRPIVEIRPIEVELSPLKLKIRPYIRLVRPDVRISILEDSLRTILISDSLRTIISRAIRPVEVATLSGEISFNSLTAASNAVLTVTEDGIVLMNRAAVPIEEIEESLKNLMDYNTEISLLILIPGGSENESGKLGYNIVEIANRLGIIKVSVKEIKP